MHFQPCLEPRKIWNSYTKSLQVVPCGKCSACLNARSARLVERLQVEQTCHRFNVFVTLTYDNEHLPVLKYNEPYLIDLCHERSHWRLGAPCIDIVEELHKLGTPREENARAFQYIKLASSHFGGLPYNSSVLYQKFIKKLRSKIVREFKKHKNEHNEKIIPQVRYYLAAEIGPTTFRPHAHLVLFIDSEWVSTKIHDYIRECWRFGNTDSSFVEHSASSYVASYLNSVSHLPLVYQTHSLRPFALFSKHPALGTLIYNSEAYKSYFLTLSLENVIFDSKKSMFRNVSLWRTIAYRLYPRLSFFDFIDNRSLHILYKSYSKALAKYGNDYFNSWRFYVESSISDLNEFKVYRQYTDLLKSYRGDYEIKLQRWYRICKRITEQAAAWGIDLDEYISKISEFYQKYKGQKLSEYYAFEEDYFSEASHPLSDRLWLDPLFLRNFIDCNLGDLTASEVYYLQSCGLDLEKFFSDDLSVRNEYQSKLFPEDTFDYKLFKAQSEQILNNSTKTKRKNDTQCSESDWYFQLLSGNFFNNDKVINLSI